MYERYPRCVVYVFLLQDVGSICEAIPALEILNLTNNFLERDTIRFTPSKGLRVLVLNNCGITWEQVSTCTCWYSSFLILLPYFFEN